MVELAFDVTGATAEPYAAVPTILFETTVRESTGARVHAIALRAQVRIEPQRRRYDPAEEERLLELFGETPQWGESLRPFPGRTSMPPSAGSRRRRRCSCR